MQNSPRQNFVVFEFPTQNFKISRYQVLTLCRTRHASTEAGRQTPPHSLRSRPKQSGKIKGEMLELVPALRGEASALRIIPDGVASCNMGACMLSPFTDEAKQTSILSFCLRFRLVVAASARRSHAALRMDLGAMIHALRRNRIANKLVRVAPTVASR